MPIPDQTTEKGDGIMRGSGDEVGCSEITGLYGAGWMHRQYWGATGEEEGRHGSWVGTVSPQLPTNNRKNWYSNLALLKSNVVLLL